MKLYRCVYQMGVETALEYRANMVLTLLSTIFPIIIQTFLWNYLYGNGDAGAMTGYSYTEIIVYTLLAGLTGHRSQQRPFGIWRICPSLRTHGFLTIF